MRQYVLFVLLPSVANLPFFTIPYTNFLNSRNSMSGKRFAISEIFTYQRLQAMRLNGFQRCLYVQFRIGKSHACHSQVFEPFVPSPYFQQTFIFPCKVFHSVCPFLNFSKDNYKFHEKEAFTLPFLILFKTILTPLLLIPVVPESYLIRLRFGPMERKKSGQSKNEVASAILKKVNFHVFFISLIACTEIFSEFCG